MSCVSLRKTMRCTSRNPFSNQVSSNGEREVYNGWNRPRRNPFSNQVSSNNEHRISNSDVFLCRNPFSNQVSSNNGQGSRNAQSDKQS